MIRAVLDTNLIVSAVLFGDVPEQVYIAGMQKRYIIVSSPALIDELQRVLDYSKFAARLATHQETPENLLANYLSKVERVAPSEVPPNAVRDPKDRDVLACAVGEKVNYVISGDKDLLTLGNYQNILILSAAAFLDILSRASGS